jgi:hypothetical protein
MKKILALLALTIAGTAFAGGETKEVCEVQKDKAGAVVKNKDGSDKKVCKKIKVHKKVEGTKVPEDTKKK